MFCFYLLWKIISLKKEISVDKSLLHNDAQGQRRCQFEWLKEQLLHWHTRRAKNSLAIMLGLVDRASKAVSWLREFWQLLSCRRSRPSKLLCLTLPASLHWWALVLMISNQAEDFSFFFWQLLSQVWLLGLVVEIWFGVFSKRRDVYHIEQRCTLAAKPAWSDSWNCVCSHPWEYLSTLSVSFPEPSQIWRLGWFYQSRHDLFFWQPGLSEASSQRSL